MAEICNHLTACLSLAVAAAVGLVAKVVPQNQSHPNWCHNCVWSTSFGLRSRTDTSVAPADEM